MMSAATKLAEDALSLPCEDRLHLVDLLLESLNAPRREDIDRRWAEEAEQRVNQIESGAADLLPGDQVFADVRKRLGK